MWSRAMSSDVSTPSASRLRFRVSRLREWFRKEVRLMARAFVAFDNPLGICATDGEGADGYVF